MWIVLDDGSAQREVAVEANAPDVTVAEVLAAAGCGRPTAVHVTGRSIDTGSRWHDAGILTGDTITLGRPPAGRDRAGRQASVPLRLGVVAGPGAGAALSLDRPVVVGRNAACDLPLSSDTVAGRHCRISPDATAVRVTDLGTRAGTWADGVRLHGRSATVPVGCTVRTGDVVLRVESVSAVRAEEGPTQGDGTVLVHRPPRAGPPPPVPPVAVPAPPPMTGAAPPFSVAAAVVPLVLAAVLVVVLGSWRYAAFLALSPVLLLVTTISGRRRARRDRRAAGRAQRTAVAAFADDLAEAAAATRSRRWEVLPSVVEVLDRAARPSTRLWERRLDDHDALRLHLGVGAVPWQPTGPADHRPAEVDDEAQRVLAEWALLPRSPVAVDLADGGVVGIVGERAGAVGLARSLLLQACVHHGPADVVVALATTTDRVADWDWAAWLPHTAAADGTRRVAAGPTAARRLCSALRRRTPTAVTLLVVVDDPALLAGRDDDVRALLRGEAGPAAGIVLAATADRLPAVCDTVVEVGDEGTASVARPAQREVVPDVAVAGLTVPACRAAARRLASRADPEAATAVGELPARVALLDLLEDGSDVAAAWARSAASPGLRVPLLVGRAGPVDLDLVRAGPHCLVGGTTGAGKSELLRSLVAGLAATHGPDRCTFVLVDYKGGAAFDACTDLPHVLGVVTDLDEHLGRRVLRSLEAELSYRERRLREAGVADLGRWLALPVPQRGAPLPRLVVVVDEFATLRADLPDMLSALVGIAQRGRSLGVHLVLGTQRPSGSVDDDVRANTNLRIALRTTDERDSVDVVGTADAAAIPPSLPGRGVVRSGPGHPQPVQTALVTTSSHAAGPRVRVTPVALGRADPAALVPAADDASAAATAVSDLERLVAACRAAAAAGDVGEPRPVWLPPLPTVVEPHDLPPAPGVPVPVGLLDEPDRQRRRTVGWDPERGNLLVHGMVGSGTTTTLASVALALARSFGPDDLHLQVVDLDRGALSPLAGLPHCGAVVTAAEPERRQRLQAWLLDEAGRRRGLDAPALAERPLLVVVVDGLDTWLDDLDDAPTYATHEAVQRLLVDAPRLRMAVVASVPRPGAVRSSLVAAVEQRLVHRLADPNDHALLGHRPGDVPDLPPGRALRPDGGVLQVARPGSLERAVAAVAAAAPPVRTPPAVIGTLPPRTPPAAVAGAAELGERRWCLPVGLDALTLEPVAWTLHAGEHALVLGPPAAGRSGLLRGLAVVARPFARVLAVAPGARDWPDGVQVRAPGTLDAALDEVVAAAEPTLVLVDDAERVPDPGGALEALAGSDVPVRVVAAARQDAVRADYGHWLRRLARSRCGLLLRPTGEDHADVLGVRVPTHPPVPTRAGRGWSVVAGTARFVQAIDAT